MPSLPKEFLNKIAVVNNKRARFVLDSIVQNGRVTTEEINHAGYEHPPRAVRDARELGFPIKTIKVKHTNGRSIAAYIFDDTGNIDSSKSGRLSLPKKKRDEIIVSAGNRCQICGATSDLQVDHRIPFEVAGESQAEEANPYLVLCGSCNRTKSWSCEHCQNWLTAKSLDSCRSCYWAQPTTHTHVAMLHQRRLDIVWTGSEVANFERIKDSADRNQISIAEEIKRTLNKCY